MTTWFTTNNARRIPVRWFTSRLRLIPVKKPPIPSLVSDDWLRGTDRPYFAAMQGSCRAPSPPAEFPI
jgi:hypothetical protein